jgi:hypothetical protein
MMTCPTYRKIIMSNYDVAASYYNNILFRDGSPEEIQAWATVLDKGAPADDVRSSFENSIEAINNVDPVLRLYDGLLGRQAEKNGADFNVDAFRANHSLETAAQHFIDSPEFQNAHAGISRADFINLLYHNSLDRAPDQAGFDYYNNSDLSYAKIAAAIIGSPESTAHNDLGQERLLETYAAGGDGNASTGLDNTPTPPETVYVDRPVPGDTVYVDRPVPGDTVYVDRPVPGPTVIQEPTHNVTHSVDATLDVTSTKNYAGTEVNFGAGNYADNYSIAEDQNSGVELGLKPHYRTGDAITSSSVDNDGTVHYTADAGYQNNTHNEQGTNVNRSGVSVDFSINTGVGDVSGANVADHAHVFKLVIDTDPSAAQKLNVFTVQQNTDGTNYMTDSAGNPVIGDSDGPSVHHYQDSFNFGFGFLNNQMVGGANVPSGDIKPGSYDVHLQEFSADGATLYADNHIVLDLIAPQPVAVTAIAPMDHGMLLA